MTKEELGQFLVENGLEDTIVFDEPAYCDAFIGVTTCGRAVYSYTLMIRALMESDDMTEEDAEEWIGYNVVPAAAQIPGGPLILDIEMQAPMAILGSSAEWDPTSEVMDKDPEVSGRA